MFFYETSTGEFLAMAQPLAHLTGIREKLKKYTAEQKYIYNHELCCRFITNLGLGKIMTFLSSRVFIHCIFCRQLV
jgi:hypothetical protein